MGRTHDCDLRVCGPRGRGRGRAPATAIGDRIGASGDGFHDVLYAHETCVPAGVRPCGPAHCSLHTVRLRIPTISHEPSPQAVTPRTSITPRSARSSNDKSPGRRKTQGLAAPLTRGSRLAPRIIFCSTEPRSIFGLCPRPRSRDREPPRARTAHPYLNKIDSWSSRRS